MDSAPLWTCPICREALILSERGDSWSCRSNHLFDRAREGYVNLLPSNKKHSSDPGDNVRMVTARRRVHTAKIYRPLADAIQAHLTDLNPIDRILDLGCGEGYYSNAIQLACPRAQVCAVDISKPAIKLAAKNNRAVNFAVASTFQLPIASSSQDVLLRIFAPADDSEIQRVLKEEGVYLEVTPAPMHLWAIRKAMYDTPEAHAVARQDIPGMQLRHNSIVEFDVELNQSLLRDLVGMTPFAHRGQRVKRERLLGRDGLAVQMAFSLNLFQK